MIGKYLYLLLSVLCILCITVGWVARAVVENKIREDTKSELTIERAWGFNESNQTWNRIRVKEVYNVLFV